jgi:acetyl esterase/lipase
MRRLTGRGGIAAAAVLAAAMAWAVALADPPVIAPDGVTHVPAFDLPPSELSSPEAKQLLALRAKGLLHAPSPKDDIAAERRDTDAMLDPAVQAMLAAYPVDVADDTIGGVPVKIVTPHGRPFDPNRVLINLHGGGFSVCWSACSMLESAPIAVVGGYKVITVNYRMAPEAAHPAALEDAAAVYRALLQDYSPRHIGVYGCSAGGALTAEFAAWLPPHGLPQAGAIGIFGAGGVPFGAGDSAYIAGNVDGMFPPPARPGEPPAPDITRGYFAKADMADPMISPALHPEVMAKFPPTLLITANRAMDMSPAIYTNSALLKAGVSSTLIVGEGLGHCYIYNAQLPEARDAYTTIAGFFRRNLQEDIGHPRH